MKNALVYNIEPASPSMIRSLDRHCADRTPDGASAIDPDRSHLNRLLVGNREGVLASLEDLYSSGVKRPAKQSESPYLRIVVSASPGYFRPDNPDAAGVWDEARLEAWLDATMKQLRAEHGADLVYVELHLDEDTPHVHAVVAPTYQKKPRVPGRKKRNETDAEFEARKEAARNALGVRTVGRASHSELSKKGSFQRLRERMAVAVEHLGIEYGEDRSIDAPPGKTTRQWVKEQADNLRKERERITKEQAALVARNKDLRKREERVSDVLSSIEALSKEIQDETIYRRNDGKIIAADVKRLSSGVPIITSAINAAADAGSALRSTREDLEKERSHIAQLKDKLREAIKKAIRFTRRSEASVIEQMEAAKMKKHASKLLREDHKISSTTEDPFDPSDGPSF